MARPSDPTRVQAPQAQDAQRSELHPLWSSYAGLILFAARVYQGDPVASSPDELRRLLEQDLQVARHRASAAGGVRSSDVDEAEFAVVVTLNEAMRMAGGALRSAWDSSPLRPQSQSRQVGLGGHDFYTALDRLEREGRTEAVWIFFLCLKAGFQGQAAPGDRQYEARLGRLAQRLSAGVSPDILFPPLTELSPGPSLAPARDPFGAQLLAAVAGALLLGLVVISWVAWSAGVLVSDLRAATPSGPPSAGPLGSEHE